MFGKISETSGGRADDLRKLVAGVLSDNGAQPAVIELIYDVPIALQGQNLPAIFAEPLSFTRATVKHPDILILDKALDSYDMETQRSVFLNLRRLLPETTVIYLNDSFENPDVFDNFIEVQQGRIVSDDADKGSEEDSAASADLNRKVRALEQTPLFSGLGRRQLRLMAFGAAGMRHRPAKPFSSKATKQRMAPIWSSKERPGCTCPRMMKTIN